MTSETGAADLADARDYLGRARREHGEPGDTFAEVYMWVLGLLLLAATTASGWSALIARAACTGAGCGHGGGPLAAVALALLALGGTAAAVRAWGPVGADAPRTTWLLSGPAPRRPDLRGRVWLVALGAALVCGLAGPTVAATAGLPITPDALAWGTPLGAVLGSLVTGCVAAAQHDPVWRTRVARLPRLLLLAGVVVAALARLSVGSASTPPGAGTVGPHAHPGALSDVLPGPGLPLPALLVAAGVLALAAALALLTLADRRSEQVDGTELRRAGESFSAAHEAALMLDASAVAQRGERARLGRRGRFGSRRGAGTGVAAVLRRDLVRVARQRDRLLLGIPLLVGCALLAAMAPALVTLPVMALAAARVARSLGDGLVLWTRSTGLRRELPLPDHQVRAALLAGPALAAALWSLAACALVGLPPATATTLTLAAVASLLAGARPRDLELMGLMIPTAFGMMPAGAMTAAQGYEIALVAVLGAVVAPWPTGVAVAAIAVAWQWSRCARAHLPPPADGRAR
ncbi:DUF6297 family protein [Arsenicicoccus dermatophilus]|uniref:DUF6297 family protein n=1 Tax=Arsenicicoccus dermatophilus TaxID=1076331 RepID=UPI0039176542